MVLPPFALAGARVEPGRIAEFVSGDDGLW